MTTQKSIRKAINLKYVTDKVQKCILNFFELTISLKYYPRVLELDKTVFDVKEYKDDVELGRCPRCGLDYC